MEIKSIVPLEISVDTQQKFISGTYVYHLEERCSGSRFVWFSTCIYSFDSDVNLTKISQQGELYPEEEADIPFELDCRDVLAKKATEFFASFDQGYNAFYNDLSLYDGRFYSFMPQCYPNPGYFQGLKHIDKLDFILDFIKTTKFECFQMVDIFVDHYDESHDVVFLLGYSETVDVNTNKEEACLFFSIFHFENGKIAKELDFLTSFVSPIPSPFDDKTFQSKNIQLT